MCDAPGNYCEFLNKTTIKADIEAEFANYKLKNPNARMPLSKEQAFANVIPRHLEMTKNMKRLSPNNFDKLVKRV
jgi:hypothetical protein